MEEEDRALIFGDVRYTIIPSDELDDEKTRVVRKAHAVSSCMGTR
jgi:hypothetical protein